MLKRSKSLSYRQQVTSMTTVWKGSITINWCSTKKFMSGDVKWIEQAANVALMKGNHY
ncbi:hypothetical protein SLT67_08850 [Paenibacillus illinoisensis]|jgi:hypothetical protein